MVTERIPAPRSGAPPRWREAHSIVVVMAAVLLSASCQAATARNEGVMDDSADAIPDDRADGPLYFASPREAVAEIKVMLVEKDWVLLSRYYDLGGTEIDAATLRSGEFFYRTRRPEVAHPGGFWRYKHPFSPAFDFDHTVATGDPGTVTVVVSIEIDEGEGMVQRGFSAFQMVEKPQGWQIRPEAPRSW